MDPVREELPASLGEILRCLRRSAPWILGWTGLGLAAGLAVLAVVRPRFRARATILIENENPAGFLGDLALLASLGSAPAAAGELAWLESRTLAELVLAEGREETGAWAPRDERRLGLATRVDDDDLRPLALARRFLFARPPPEIPLVLPPRELRARVTSAAPEAPRTLRLTFLDAHRLRLEGADLGARLGLRSAEPMELDYAPRQPISYRGLVLELEASGDCAGASFRLEHLPGYEALEALQESLRVRESAPSSGVIELVVEDSDPRRAARIANALGANYLDALRARGQKRASSTYDYLQGLLDEEFERFGQAQEQILAIQQGSPELLAPESAAGALIAQLSALEVERVQLDLSRHAFGEIVAALEQGDAAALARIDGTLEVGVLVDPVTSGLLAELARLEARSSTLGAELLEEHPLVRENRAARQDLVQRTREQLAERQRGLLARSEELRRHGEELRVRMGALPAGMRELAEARIQIEVHRELVPYLIKGLQGAEITRSSAETLADFVDVAVPPTEVAAPRPARTLVSGALLGLLLGVVGAVLREPRRGRVHTAQEFSAAIGDRALSLPSWPVQGELVLAADPAGKRAEALRALRTLLSAAPESESRQVLGVTSPRPDPPAVRLAPRLAAELALSFALAGRRTLLLEADLRRPSQAGHFGAARAERGLAHWLEHGGDWRELPVATGTAGLELLPAGAVALPAGDLASRPALGRLLVEAREHYEVLVVDLPACQGAPEVLGLARALDALVLVHRSRGAPRAALRALAEDLRAAGAPRLCGLLVGRTSE